MSQDKLNSAGSRLEVCCFGCPQPAKYTPGHPTNGVRGSRVQELGADSDKSEGPVNVRTSDWSAKKIAISGQGHRRQCTICSVPIKFCFWEEKIRLSDSDAVFEPNCKEVQCSTCKSWVKMKELYNTSRFKEHSNKGCEPPPPPPPLDTTTRTLDLLKIEPQTTRPKLNKSVAPAKILLPCPGLTAAYNENVGKYLDRAGSNGGGARVIGHYCEKLFQKELAELSDKEKQLAYAAQQHDHTWRNDVSPGIIASFATGEAPCLKSIEVATSDTSPSPCASCLLVFTSRAYQKMIKKPTPDAANLRYVPHRNQKAHAGKIYARFKGLEELVSEDNEFSLERRYVHHVINGDFKNDTVFNDILQAKILGKAHEIKRHGNQNFKHDEDVDAVFGLVHAISPRAYRKIAKHIPLRSERSIKYATKYLEDYSYPLGAPLSLSVDDTKLHAALRPLYDGAKGKWFIVGTTGMPMEVPNADVINETLDRLEKTAEIATKVAPPLGPTNPSPWCPPTSAMAISSKVKGAQLAEWQLQLMKGLISRGFRIRISSSGGDGAAVERECHRITAAASKKIEYRIKHPDPDYPDIIVTIYDLNGNIWVDIQNAKHGWKTFKNNASSGARGLVIGNHVVYFGQIFGLAMHPDSPMYPRDVNEKRDRMDDPAASRLFSADTLTWHLFLQRAAYSEARHFISKEAFAISEILVNGLLGLILIHRDHLGDHPTPLLPWFNASEPNEHCLSGLRDVSKDATFQEAVPIVPKLRAKLQTSVRARLDPAIFKKQASGYCHTYYTSEDIDFALLGQYPTDVELSTTYQIAAEENDCLWSLLGIHPAQIRAAPLPGLVVQPSPDPTLENLYLAEDDIIAQQGDVSELTAAEEVQNIIDNLQTTVGLTRAEGEQLDACVMAAVALSMDELAKIEDLPESNPERFAEIQREIANAMATQPSAFCALLQGIAANSTAAQASSSVNTTSSPTVNPPSSHPLCDFSGHDLAQLVALRREHQTREEKTGVRTYRASTTYTNHKTGIVKVLTDRQWLAQAMHAIVKRDYQQGSSAGLNRSTRWKTDSSTLPVVKTGNAANAVVTAAGRANETIKRRRTIFAKLKSLSTVAKASVGSSLITMYSRNGGKAGTYENSYRRQFKNTRRADLSLGAIERFAHFPSNSFLAILPVEANEAESVKIYANHVEIGSRAYAMFESLMVEKELLCKAVATLNTVRCKGKADISLAELPEDDWVAE
ncbi:hypothetical protein B0H17DRAFT_1180926 [Mycena rosella]|uniref:Uncharacterized protein n=1 Tax=Mycena rosella TaxID=1033263 RepID=A0AAD7GG54_MYCRO|nr:hypothetical protein B0H17DRAFT_1180926 [Mycena rosella]